MRPSFLGLCLQAPSGEPSLVLTPFVDSCCRGGFASLESLPCDLPLHFSGAPRCRVANASADRAAQLAQVYLALDTSIWIEPRYRDTSLVTKLSSPQLTVIKPSHSNAPFNGLGGTEMMGHTYLQIFPILLVQLTVIKPSHSNAPFSKLGGTEMMGHTYLQNFPILLVQFLGLCLQAPSDERSLVLTPFVDSCCHGGFASLESLPCDLPLHFSGAPRCRVANASADRAAQLAQVYLALDTSIWIEPRYWDTSLVTKLSSPQLTVIKPSHSNAPFNGLGGTEMMGHTYLQIFPILLVQ
ncbi:hypothetical protein V5799_016660, partial [Amblyomma americanum]